MILFISYVKNVVTYELKKNSYVKLFRSHLKSGISYVNFFSTYEILHFTYEILDFTYEIPISYVKRHEIFERAGRLHGNADAL